MGKEEEVNTSATATSPYISRTGDAELEQERTFVGAMRCHSRSGWTVYMSWPLGSLTITHNALVIAPTLRVLRRFVPSRRIAWQDIRKIERVKAGIRILEKGKERNPIIFLLRPFLLLPLTESDIEVLRLLELRGVQVDRSIHPTHWFGPIRSAQ